ncbi:TMEM175 family protein [Luminiphilus sp.]|nr:TMEM175 family protein [Luminiphilus sp.]
MNFKSERLLGLVDGVYAIALTLFALELHEDLTKILESEHGVPLALLKYSLVYCATFFLLFDLWLVHKTILMSKHDREPSSVDLLSFLALLIVTTIPGIMLAGLDVFIDEQLGAQTSSVSTYRLLGLGIYWLGYCSLILLERSLDVRHSKHNIRYLSSGRAIVFSVALGISCVSYFLFSDYVVPLPLVVAVMLASKIALKHHLEIGLPKN